MIRLGLCCVFKEEPIKFRITTARELKKFSRAEQIAKLSELCRHNAETLLNALKYCSDNGIGDFRIGSDIIPLRTHPEVGYNLDDLLKYDALSSLFSECRSFAKENNIRTTLHPDQFILLSSPHHNVTENSITELIHQAEIAELTNADVINIHAGGTYGDKKEAIKRLKSEINSLPDSVRSRLTLENDDRQYSPADLLPICEEMKIPLVYDVHHHRCHTDNLSVEQATELALKTWNREPLFHLSSPKEGWESKNPRLHHDYIDVHDFPECWTELDITIEIEAKAKELAIKKLKDELDISIKR